MLLGMSLADHNAQSYVQCSSARDENLVGLRPAVVNNARADASRKVEDGGISSFIWLVLGLIASVLTDLKIITPMEFVSCAVSNLWSHD